MLLDELTFVSCSHVLLSDCGEHRAWVGTDALGTMLPGCSYWDCQKFGILRILLEHKILPKVNSKLRANETRLIWTFFPLLISMILSMSIRTRTWYTAVTTVYKKFNCTFYYPWLLHNQLSRNLLTAPAAQGPSLAVTAAWLHFLITSYKIHPQKKKKNQKTCILSCNTEVTTQNISLYLHGVEINTYFLLRTKGVALWGLSLAKLPPRALSHCIWGESPCLCYMYNITSTKPRGETLHLQEITKMRPTGLKGTKVALLNEAGTMLK